MESWLQPRSFGACQQSLVFFVHTVFKQVHHGCENTHIHSLQYIMACTLCFSQSYLLESINLDLKSSHDVEDGWMDFIQVANCFIICTPLQTEEEK